MFIYMGIHISMSETPIKHILPGSEWLADPTGRPEPTYSPELMAVIRRRIAIGQDIYSICKFPGMPSVSTYFDWLNQHPDDAKKHDQALITGCRRVAADLLHIVDEPVNGEHWQAVRQRKDKIEVRKWLISKYNPERFGDSSKVQHSGSIDTPAQTTPLETAMRVAAILEAAAKRSTDPPTE